MHLVSEIPPAPRARRSSAPTAPQRRCQPPVLAHGFDGHSRTPLRPPRTLLHRAERACLSIPPRAAAMRNSLATCLAACKTTAARARAAPRRRPCAASRRAGRRSRRRRLLVRRRRLPGGPEREADLGPRAERLRVVRAVAARDGGGAQVGAPRRRPVEQRARAAARLAPPPDERQRARAAAVAVAERLPGDRRRAARGADLGRERLRLAPPVRGARRRDPRRAPRAEGAARLPAAEAAELGVQTPEEGRRRRGRRLARRRRLERVLPLPPRGGVRGELQALPADDVAAPGAAQFSGAQSAQF